MNNKLYRCPWSGQSQLYIDYHDNEWGMPSANDRHLFEMLILEGAQAGLSWITVLKKRENYRAAFDNFDYHKIAKYDDKKVATLLQNDGIIRNRLKVNSAIKNAIAFIAIQQEFGSFAKYLWSYVDDKPIQNHHLEMDDVPAKTALSDKISVDLKKRGMSFVGSTIIYAYMQAIGLVNDHLTSCCCYDKAQDMADKFKIS